MIRRSVVSVDGWWRALEAVRLLRGLSRRELATTIQGAAPRRTSEARRSPSYAEVYHPGMLIPRAFAAMEILGCRLCGWRSLAETLAGLEDRRRSKRRRPATEVSPRSTGSRTLLRDALASGDLWFEIDDTDDDAFDAALTRVAEGNAADSDSKPEAAVWPRITTDPRVDVLRDRLDRLEGRIEVASTRSRPRRGHVDALVERLVALEARVLAVEAALKGPPPQERLDDITASDASSAPEPINAGDSDGDEAAVTAPLIALEPGCGDDTESALARVDDEGNAEFEDDEQMGGVDPDGHAPPPDGESVADPLEIVAAPSRDLGDDVDEAARRDADPVLMSAFRHVRRDVVDPVDDGGNEEDAEDADSDSQGPTTAPATGAEPHAYEEAPQTTAPTLERRKRRRRKKRRR